MKPTKKMQRLLEQMAKIDRMERGKLCRMSGRAHYNHQTWHDNRNVVRYVPKEQAAFVQEAIDGYTRFRQLAEAYADEVITHTRREREKAFPKRKPRKPKSNPKRPRKAK